MALSIFDCEEQCEHYAFCTKYIGTDSCRMYGGENPVIDLHSKTMRNYVYGCIQAFGEETEVAKRLLRLVNKENDYA